MAPLSKRRKALIRWSIGAILAVDVGFLAYNLLRQVPTSDLQKSEELQAQARQVRLREDVHLAQSFRERIPEVRKQDDEFYTRELQPASTGYSSIVADLNGVGKAAGLHLTGLTFTQHDVGSRGITEIQITGQVEGAYPNLVGFINGLERSNSFYVLESLELASSTGSELRMNVKLKTYFRT